MTTADERRLDPLWTSSTGVGNRRVDDYERIGGQRTTFEANTTPWETMTQKKYQDKIDQIGAEVDLLHRGLIDRSIWFGTDPLPDKGLGADLAKALREAGIVYFHIPWLVSD